MANSTTRLPVVNIGLPLVSLFRLVCDKLPLLLKFNWMSWFPPAPKVGSGWFRKLNAEKRIWIFWRSVRLKFLYAARSLLKNAGPLMYGQMMSPFDLPVGGAKQGD